ncbi:MAG: phytoene desaturase [Bacteroidia bacterium]|nr:phytoene desaturase [Bacteroidia bacterium]
MKKVNIIGSGFSSLSAACYLAQSGLDVHVYEKNDQPGGRARLLEAHGFRFDMGPSWYWMPDVFDRFFEDFGYTTSEFYNLIRLTPAYKVFFEDFSNVELPSSVSEICDFFEAEEPGSSQKLKAFLKKAQFNYETAMQDLVYKPGASVGELITPKTITRLGQFFTTIRSTVRSDFKSSKLIQILEFPVLFLGAKPENTPAFYNFMNYADLVLGTWYPEGGMHQIVRAMVKLAKQLGVQFHMNASVDEIVVEDGKAKGLRVNGELVPGDLILSGADYHHTEQLLNPKYRSFSDKYWQSRTFAPSALIFYLGFDKKLKNLRHHNLFFDEDFDIHARAIYDHIKWPENPLFYASFPSMTDSTVAPEGQENGFILIPLAPGLKDDKQLHQNYRDLVIKRLEQHTGQKIADHIVYSRSYCVNDFQKDYNSYKGNAYGMANTLRQTGFLRPGIRSKKVENLFFTGQLTVPGPGVPPALISGKISSELIIKEAIQSHSYASI